MSNLTEKAMLVRFHSSRWSARKHDRKISDEVAENHGVRHAADAGRYNKLLVAREALQGVTRAESAARAFHAENTLPWAHDGARILPAANYFSYTAAMRDYRADFEREVDAFCARYDEVIADARLRLNGLFVEADYPRPTDIRARFAFDVAVEPLPAAAYFRVTLGDDEEARIRREIERRLRASVDGAVTELWLRVHDCVARTAERLRLFQPATDEAPVQHPFRDSLVSNLRDMVDLLPRLNLTGDPRLDQMRLRLAELLPVADARDDAATARHLRESDAAREQVARAAEDILRDMAGYVGSAAA